jgi:uncharacterized protein (TIGR00369 family)
LDKQTFLQQMEKAWDHSRNQSVNLCLFHLLDFQFSYDDEDKICRIECPIIEPMLNPLGTVHGGIYTYMADTAMGHLNSRCKGPYVSLELKTSYFRATNAGKLIATARYVKDGYKVVFMECIIENEKGEVMCITSGTFYRFEKSVK